MSTETLRITKIPTGIPGFDYVAGGGLPKNRTTLVCGSAGSGKTIFAVQFAMNGVEHDEPGLIVTFEEHPEDIRRNVASFGWDLQKHIDDGHLLFVDASPSPDLDGIVAGSFDFGALIARLENAVNKIGAKRVVLDSLGSVFTRFQNVAIIRAELYRLSVALKEMGVTSVMTAERDREYGPVTRHDIEEYVADNVVILRNVLNQEQRRRSVEILKFRGTQHHKGEYTFTITEGGILVVPMTGLELREKSSHTQISTGLKKIDEMCNGGFFSDSVVLVSGATGTGKSLTVTHFLNGGLERGEKCLLFAFEESKEQFFRNAGGWGMKFAEVYEDGQLWVENRYPEITGLEDHLVGMQKAIDQFEPDRVAIDSLSAIQRIATEKSFREFVLGLVAYLKSRGICGMFTSTTETLLGGSSVTEAHISTITDAIILLRYVEMFGSMRRCLNILKMRGSAHDKEIREFSISENGMEVGGQLRNISGIISGNPVYMAPSELDRVSTMFEDN
jgi:circadian clock protein KaiC